MAALTGPLVSPAWLMRRMRTAGRGLRVLNATWYMPAAKREPKKDHLKKRSLFFDIDGIADRSTTLPHMLPSPAAFADAVGRGLGVGSDDDVVVYDDHGIFSAPRVWWTFKVFGHDRVAVLEGGLPKWVAEGLPTEEGPVAPVKPAVFRANFRPEMVRSMQDVRGLLSSRAAQIMDARPRERFTGEQPEPRAGLSSGHYPGSRSVPFGAVLTPDKSAYLPPSELARVFRNEGVDLGRPIVAACGSGITACVIGLAAELAGAKNVAVYDGSWTEWASHPDNPIEKGP